MTKILTGQKPELEDLEHFGVKGMKWGVRKEKDAGSNGGPSISKRAARKQEKRTAKEDLAFAKNAVSARYMISVLNDANARGQASIDAINAKPEYKDADFRRPSQLRAKYYEEHRANYERVLNDIVAERGNTSASGRYKIEVQADSPFSFPTFLVRDTTIAHAADEEGVWELDVTFADNGHVVSFDGVSEELAQSAIAHATAKGKKFISEFFKA